MAELEATTLENNNDQPTTRAKRSVYRVAINRIRNIDGEIIIMTPKMSTWYTTYVVNPQLDCKKFIDKFRRRFRCSYTSYINLLVLIQDSPF